MKEEKHKTIDEYLSKNIPNKGVVQKHDSDWSTFKVFIDEKDFHLFKFRQEFVKDHDISTIIRQLGRCLPQVLAKNRKCVVCISDEGIKILPA